MTRYTIELTNGANFEVDAKSLSHARQVAVRQMDGGQHYNPIVEVRAFAAKARKPAVPDAPDFTMKPDPFAVLARLLP